MATHEDQDVSPYQVMIQINDTTFVRTSEIVAAYKTPASEHTPRGGLTNSRIKNPTTVELRNGSRHGADYSVAEIVRLVRLDDAESPVERLRDALGGNPDASLVGVLEWALSHDGEGLAEIAAKARRD